MPFLFGDTFDGYPDADKLLKWTNTIGIAGMKVNTESARNGTQGLACDPGTNFSGDGFTGGTGPGIRKTLVPTDPTTCVYRFAFKYVAVSGATMYTMAAVLDNAAAQIMLVMLSDGRLSICFGDSGTNILGTSTQALLAGVWYHIKIYLKLHATTGNVKLWINAVQQFSFTGNTRGAGTSVWTNIIAGVIRNSTVGGTTYVKFFYDDLNVRDDDDGRFDLIGICLRAQTGNGTRTGYTPSTGTDHGAMVDDVNQDGDATCNTGTAIGQIDNYNIENLPSPASIAFIQTTEVTRKTDAGDRFVNNVLTIGGVDYVGPPQAPTQVYSHLLTPYDNSPANPTQPFNDSEINAMLSGQKITG